MSKLLNYLAEAAFLGFLFFNRQPVRNITPGNNLVAPADGTILISKSNTIEIFIGILDNHYQLAPADGVITNIYEPTKEYSLIEMDTDYGHINIERWAGDLAKTVITYIKVGQHVKKGDFIGRILLGSHTSVSIPFGLDVKVVEGQHIKAGETIIATPI
jgi:phosphatidylserine decarboxylase